MKIFYKIFFTVLITNHALAQHNQLEFCLCTLDTITNTFEREIESSKRSSYLTPLTNSQIKYLQATPGINSYESFCQERKLYLESKVDIIIDCAIMRNDENIWKYVRNIFGTGIGYEEFELHVADAYFNKGDLVNAGLHFKFCSKKEQNQGLIKVAQAWAISAPKIDTALSQKELAKAVKLFSKMGYTKKSINLLIKDHESAKSTNSKTVSKNSSIQQPISANLIQDNYSLADSSNSKAFLPPIITIKDNAVLFIDPNRNNSIDAYENSTLHFDLKNTGKGDAYDMKVKLVGKGNITGIGFSSSTNIPTIKAGAIYTVEIPVKASGVIENGNVTFTVKVDEPHGLGSDPIDIEISTKAFNSPLVRVVDCSVTGASGGNLTRKQPFDVQVLVQNTKPGTAENVRVEIKIPDNILLISGEKNTTIGTLIAGATKEILYSMIVTDHYTSNSISLSFQLQEKYGKYTEDTAIILNLNQALSSNKITVTASVDNTYPEAITEASLKSDVDKNIPVTSVSNAHRYALVIGNEDYSKYQPSLSSESNVAFALADARIFAVYCEKTLGIPKENINLLENAIGSKMNRKIEEISKLVQYENGNAEVIFYYAGHGFPDEATKESYIMPVDISGGNVAEGIKLSDIYQKLTANPVKRVSVFLDACFSGGGRNSGLLSARSVKIKPKATAVSGNLIVLSASTGEQSSLSYIDKQHGMFTYFLLKKLQETKGDVLYNDLFNYVKHEVNLNSIKVNGKDQNPQLNYSSAIDGIWEGWKLR